LPVATGGVWDGIALLLLFIASPAPDAKLGGDAGGGWSEI
jgi:hypothetical protein